MKKYIGMLIIAGLCSSASAVVVTNATFEATPGASGSTVDLFQNATVTASSKTNEQFALFDIRNLFTSGSPVANEFGQSHEDVVFADTNGLVHHVEFEIAEVQTIRRLQFVLINDGESPPEPPSFPEARALVNIKVFARGTAGAFSPSELIADVDVEKTYTASYGGPNITAEIVLPAGTTGQYFRCEFTQPDIPKQYAPRVHEVDAFNWVLEDGGVGTAEFGPGDPSDDLQFATVTAASLTHAAFASSRDINDTFTSGTPILSDDPIVFTDGGSSVFLDFNIPSPRTLTNMTFTLQNDPGGARGATYIRLFASLSPGDVMDNPIIGYNVDPDYENAYSATNRISYSIDLPIPVNAQYLSVEIGHTGSTPWLVEIDGYGPVYVEPVFPATIISLTPVSSSVFKMVIDAPGTKTKYSPQATTDLISVAGTPVKHSDNAGGPFELNTLDVSASEGTNEVIYVEADTANKFYSIEYAN